MLHKGSQYSCSGKAIDCSTVRKKPEPILKGQIGETGILILTEGTPFGLADGLALTGSNFLI